ncbi:MAG: transporter substrate-binding domain-containing protein [Gammaproteobacteria bacterium]|nr:transporter substrate-binding domain-containing protein [Gammaproteobacteria bacterium]
MTDWPPYMIARPNQPPQGIAIEYLKLIGERTGLRFSYETEIRSFAGLLESMRQRNGPDLIPLVVKTPERETYLSFSENYISSPNVIIGRLQDDLIWDISGLSGKMLAVPKAFKVQEQLAGNYPDIRLVLFDTDEQALQAVATRRADTYIGNLTVASHIIQERGFSDLRVVAPSPFGDHVLAMGNRKDWPELTAIISKTMASISEEEKNAIRDRYVALRYVTRGVSREVMLQRIVTVVAVVLGILLLFFVWNWSLRKEVRRRTEALRDEVSERKQQESTLREHQQRLKRLASELTLTEERERRQIAAELHDHVGQSLAVMRMQLAVAKKETNGRKVGSVLDELSDSLRQAIRDTRSIMSDLSSPTLNELGLSAAISDWLREQIGERHGLQTRFSDDGEPKPLSDDIRAILFRSVRELLMNVVKHAGASHVTVSIQCEDNAVKIIVEDDGAGMPATIEVKHPAGEGGFGLFSIEERMHDLGGSLSIESSPGQGVRAILTVPFEVQ